MTEYSEDQLVEQEAIKVFKDSLKIDSLNLYEEKFPQTLGRETKSEVVIVSKLLSALEKLNTDLSEDAKKEVVAQVLQDRTRLSMFKANQEVYKLLKDGVKIKAKNSKGIYEYKTVKIIDFNNPDNNDYFLSSQFWITGEMYTRRPDLILFVNGIPLVIIELKARGVDVKRAFEDNITDYKDTIPKLFWYNAFILISNGRESKIGTLTSEYEHFSDWKKITENGEKGIIPLDTIIRGTCEKSRLLDLIENFILYTSIKEETKRIDVKIIAKNHQYHGVNSAVESFKERKKNNGRLGVFWHTQGSGKSFSMVFFAQKILRKFEGNYTFLVVTDRKELDGQIYGTFQDSGVVTEVEVQAKDGAHLKQLLKEDHRLLFTLIHKFRTEKGKPYEKLTDRNDIIVMTDEAHRTQYDVLAMNMRSAIPNASFIGFTGTPLMAKGEEKTKETFGKYVSVYNFREAISDKSTVPLFYENRVPELALNNPEFNDKIYEVIENADLDEQQQDKFEKEFNKEYHIITNKDRLNIIAKDIVNHYANRGYQGKAMVVSVDKVTAVRMYDRVQEHWKNMIKELEGQLKKATFNEKAELMERISDLKKTDMAVVVSSEQNEIQKFKKEGLDILTHRKRMVEEDLETKFKDSKNNFKIVFLCNMWMTGFDVPSLSTIYLDKPMKNHTLMQTIARANRVFKDKQAGFIVDYINIFRNLQKALAIYAQPTPGNDGGFPIQSKDKLVEELEKKIIELNKFLSKIKINYKEIIKVKGLEKHKLLDDALDKLVLKEETKKEFLLRAGIIIKVNKAIMPHKKVSALKPFVDLYKDLIAEVRSLDPEVDITGVVQELQGVIDESVKSKGYVIRENNKVAKINLSDIDFLKIKKQFEKDQNAAQIERLKNLLSFKLKELLQFNSTRINYQEKLEELISDYNSGALNVDVMFKKLVDFSQSLQEEERRAVTEGLTEEELAIFDKLKKPNLSQADINKLKTIAKELLAKLEPAKLVLDWRKKPQTRAAVLKEIEVELDRKLPKVYDENEFRIKCDVTFQHFFENYFGEGQNIYHIQ